MVLLEVVQFYAELLDRLCVRDKGLREGFLGLGLHLNHLALLRCRAHFFRSFIMRMRASVSADIFPGFSVGLSVCVVCRTSTLLCGFASLLR